jgi:hypothetical protein
MFGSIVERLSKYGVRYYGELFGAYSSRREIANITAKYPAFGIRYLRVFFSQRRDGNHHPFAFEEAGIDMRRAFEVLQATPGIHVVKIFPPHVRPETLGLVFETIRPHIIFIRRNHRERFLSLKRAKASGKWARSAYGDHRVDVAKGELEKFQADIEYWYREVKGKACSLDLQIDDVDYRELLNPSTLRPVLSRMTGIPEKELTDDELRPSTTKQGADAPGQDFHFEKFICCAQHEISN